MTDPLDSALAEWVERTLAGETLDLERFVRERDLDSAAFQARVANARWLVGRHLAAREAPAIRVPELPFRLGDIEVLAAVGRGAMGIVYRARQLGLDRPVAVKILAPTQDNGSRGRERFLQEARAAARIDHPHAVRVLAVGEHEGLAYLVMDWVEGETLAALLRRRTGRPASHKEAATLCAKVARALHAAHAQGIVHRDVKPANILVDVHGEPRLADFGLAKDVAAATLTATGEWVGSPAYASPEQITGQRKIGAPADVWSLAVVLYECLTLARPFPGETVESVTRRILGDEPVPPRRRDASIPPPLEAICLKALAKNPAGRYQDMAAFAADLEAFVRGEAVSARRPSLFARTGRFLRKHRVAAGAALALTTIAGMFWLFRGTSHELQASERRRTEAELFEALLVRDIGDYQQQLTAACARYPGDPDLMLLRALEHLARGELGAAAEVLARLPAKHPVDTLTRQLASVREFVASKAQTGAPRALIDDLATDEAADARALLGRAYLLGALGHWLEARTLLAAVRFRAPRFAKLAAAGEVAILRKLGRHLDAYAIYAPYVAASSPARAFYQLVTLAQDAKAPEPTQESLQRLSAVHPRSACCQVAAVRMLGAQAKDFQRAEELLALAQQAIDWPDVEPLMLGELAAYWHLVEQHPKAVAAYERYLARAPANAGILGALGVSRVASGDREFGLQDLERAAKLADHLPLERDVHWGTYWFFAGDIARAVAHMRESCRLVPSDPRRQRSLGAALARFADQQRTIVDTLPLLREAVDACRRESGLLPHEPRAWYLLATNLDALTAHLELLAPAEVPPLRAERQRVASEKAQLLEPFADRLRASERKWQRWSRDRLAKRAESRATSR